MSQWVSFVASFCLVAVCACSDAQKADSDASGSSEVVTDSLGFPTGDTGMVADTATEADTGTPTATDAGTDEGPAPDLTPVEPDEGACLADCTNKDCGSDGCGGLCGGCTGTDICSDAGTCEPDPQAGCAGLDLAEDWAGALGGDAVFKVVGFDLSSDFEGTLAYSITCFNSKFIVSGEMNGVAEDNEFNFLITGTYNPETLEMKTTVSEGVVFVFQVATEFEFDGWLNGTLQADGTFAGQFDMQAVKASNALLGELDPASYEASAVGDWTASPAP